MNPAIRAERLRLLSLRSTAVFATLLVCSCVAPIIVMGLIYDPVYQGPIDASDLGKCVSIFHILAIAFTGTYTATEIRSGSPAISFLTQKHRQSSLIAQYVVTSVFLTLTYLVGMCLSLGAALFYPDGLVLNGRGWAYLGLYAVIVLLWSLIATSIAVITRSIAVAVAAPITWMLLIEQLIVQIPMLEEITPWLPFTASHTLLTRTLGEGSAVGTTVPSTLAIVIPVLVLIGTASILHSKRDAP